MNADGNRIIVTQGECACHSVYMTRVHHRDYPEIWAEGGSAREGAEQLVGSLVRAQDGDPGAWHQDAMAEAIADLESFLASLKDAEADAPTAASPA